MKVDAFSNLDYLYSAVEVHRTGAHLTDDEVLRDNHVHIYGLHIRNFANAECLGSTSLTFTERVM